ncbi:MAG: ATP-binding protein [Pseudomonadota bacterium]
METKLTPPPLPDPSQAGQLLQSLFAIADVMNEKKMTFPRRIDRILRIVLDFLGVEQGSLMVLEGKELVVRAATRKEIIGHKQSLADESVASWVVRSKKALFITDISKDRRFAQRKGIYKKDSLLSAPVIHKDQVIGVINATDKTGTRDMMKEDNFHLLHLSSFILWTFIQQNLHKKITQQRNTLRKRNQELRRQEELRAHLSRMLIHDLKTPLSEVVANLDILSYSITGNEKEFLEAAQMGCDRAVRMVANLVTTDKIAEGKLQLLYEETDCLELLNEALSSITGLARIKNITLVQHPEADAPRLTVDRTLILRVLQNLLTNSLSYSQADSAITTGFKMSGKRFIEFYVQDQGPGIPLEQQETIFDKYARVSRKQDSLVGAGLGLHFCKLAVELHNGKIGVESKEGRGSRFFFTLPIG